MRCRRLAFILLFATLLTGCSYIPAEYEYLSSDYPEEVYEEQIEQNKDVEDDAYGAFTDKSSSIYYETFDRVMEHSNGGADDKPLSERFFRGGFQIYSTIRSIAPVLFVGSMFIGLMVYIAARHNKKVRSVGLYGFMIGIPVFLIIFIYGMGIVIDMFLF